MTVSTKPVTVTCDNTWHCLDGTKKTCDNTFTDIMSVAVLVDLLKLPITVCILYLPRRLNLVDTAGLQIIQPNWAIGHLHMTTLHARRKSTVGANILRRGANRRGDGGGGKGTIEGETNRWETARGKIIKRKMV